MKRQASYRLFEQLYHESGAITNLLQRLTNDGTHLETNVQQALSGRKGLVFDKNVVRMLDFMEALQNPFIVMSSHVTLHNIVTNVAVANTIKIRLLKALENGEKAYQAYHNECFVEKSRKLAATMHRVKTMYILNHELLDSSPLF